MYNQEQVVDDIVMGDLVKQYPQLKKLIKTASPHEIRGGVLSVLDTDRKLHSDYKKYYELNNKCNYGTYTDEIVNILREYVKVADVEKDEHGEVMTPISLVEEMLDTLPKEVWSNKDLKWLDPCNGVGTFPSVVVQRLMKGLEEVIPNAKKRYRHIIEEMIYVCELQAKNMYIFHCVFDKQDIYELNTFYGSFLTKEFDEHMNNVWGVDKFDIVIGNPPYLQGLHYKFLNKGFDILNDEGLLYIIHPSTAFLNKKDTKRTKHEQRTIDIVSDYKTELTLIDGNKTFIGAGFFVPISLTKTIKKENKSIKTIFSYHNKKNPPIKITNSLNDISIHANDIVIGIKEKIFRNMETSVENNLFRNGKIGNLYLNINKMSGHPPKEGKLHPDFYCMIYKKYENNISSLITNRGKEKSEQKGGSQFNQIAINTEEEALNVGNYLITKFARFCLSIYKIASYIDCGELKSVPFMNPNVSWTDEMLFNHFELNEDEINFINDYIGDWYEKDFQNN